MEGAALTMHSDLGVLRHTNLSYPAQSPETH